MGEIKQLGRYEIVRVLGRGAMGVVYEGHDGKLHRRVAIKTITRSAMRDGKQAAEYSERFMREAQSVARLNHPNIVTVYDFGEENDVAYFVMEFIQGREMKEYLEGSEPFALTKSLGCMIELLNALDYAHAQGIVHRDVKPANIMIEDSGRVKLTDFGVVKLLDGQERTLGGAMVGTPGYMSPEQILGAPVSPRSDIFAAGVVFHQLLTWKRPFEGEGIFSIQQKIVNEDRPLPSTFNPGVPPAVDRIVARALARNPEERYVRAAEFAEEIRRFISGGMAGGRAEAGAAAAVVAATAAVPPRAEREEPGATVEDKFSRFITVMFTDIKDSTFVAEKEGDMAIRALIKAQADIILPAIREHNGTYVKSIGDGSLSYFAEALDAVRAAARIQREMDALNLSGKFKFPVLMRIGLHSGNCVVEEHDIYGCVVNTASRFEAAADPGGILLSEKTYHELRGESDVYCRFVKQVTLKGKEEPCNAYKAFWNPEEIELDRQGAQALPRQEYAVPVRSSGMKLAWGVAALIGLVLLLTLGAKFFGAAQPVESTRALSEASVPSSVQEGQR